MIAADIERNNLYDLIFLHGVKVVFNSVMYNQSQFCRNLDVISANILY